MLTEFKSGILLFVAYDGAQFHGMARQRDVRTVAAELERAIHTMDPQASPVRFVSRTDAGVHAFQQVVAFDTARQISARGWVLGLTKQLHHDVAVTQAAIVSTGFDPRHHVLSKTYEYRIHQSEVRDPFLEHRAWRVGERLNHDLMTAEAKLLVGTHDFAAFRSAGDNRINTQRTLTRVSLESTPSGFPGLSWVVQGDHFLMHMVRIIVGSLVDVGRGRLAPGATQRALTSCDRRDLGVTAPASGLFLKRVVLDASGADRWPQVDDSSDVT
jgi:tRNA pseudouridine38-40 synthase